MILEWKSQTSFSFFPHYSSIIMRSSQAKEVFRR